MGLDPREGLWEYLEVCGKIDAEGGSFTRFACDINAAIVRLYDGLDLAQAQAEAS